MAQYGNKSVILSKQVEVGNAEGEKWNSSDAQLSGHIPVTYSEISQIWCLERHEKKPLWSFHVKSSTGNKLYVTYNGKSPVDENVTLEIESNNGSFYYRQSITNFCEIEEAASNQKWISCNACSRQPISLDTSSCTQLWKVSGAVGCSKFQAPDSDKSNAVYASRPLDDDSSDEVMFESPSDEPENYREFLMLHAQIPGAMILRNASSNKYIGTSRETREDLRRFLEFKNQVKQASEWRIILAQIEFAETDGKTTTIFPEFEVK